MSTSDVKVIGWTQGKALLGMKSSIATRWEVVKSPKCILYYAFPYRRSDEGRELGSRLKVLLHNILPRSNLLFITAADSQSSISADPNSRLIATLVCDLTETELAHLLSRQCWTFNDLTVFVHPWHPSSQYQFVGLLRGSESLNDVKLLKCDLTDAVKVEIPRNISIEVCSCVDTTYRAVYFYEREHEYWDRDMATLRTMSFDTVLGTQKIVTPQPCDLCLGIDHSHAHCPFRKYITYDIPLDGLSKSSKRRRSAGEDEPNSKKIKVAESSDVEL